MALLLEIIGDGLQTSELSSNKIPQVYTMTLINSVLKGSVPMNSVMRVFIILIMQDTNLLVNNLSKLQ